MYSKLPNSDVTERFVYLGLTPTLIAAYKVASLVRKEMCILFLYIPPEPVGNYELLVLNNRDEFTARPARAAHHWESHAHCIGGTDETEGKEGGTWFGM